MDQAAGVYYHSHQLDHVEYLGDTIEKIAGEKAGIIKPKAPVIYDGHNAEAARVIKARAKTLDSPSYALTEEVCEMQENTAQGIEFLFRCGLEDDTSEEVEAVDPLYCGVPDDECVTGIFHHGDVEKDHGISRETLIQGLAATRWEGRMETILPGVIVDGAHNADGVKRFMETACHFGKEYPITLLFSAVCDPGYRG